MIKVLIVDDKAEVRDLLSIYLKNYPDATLAGSAENVDEAVELTLKNSPDVVLLDISMPGKDGFSYISEIKQTEYYPGIIFVTAFDNYAIRAIRNAAFDYLVKPIKPEDLYSALDRFREFNLRKGRTDYSELVDLLKNTRHERIKLNTRTGYFFVDPDDIIFCEADGNYSHIYLYSGRKELSSLNLGNLEKLLGSYKFARISRSFIINLKYLSRVDRRTSTCEMEYNGFTQELKIPAQKIRMLDDLFS